jgi:ubiquinone/menaquinone biosynthesis C-methylase UbiE
VADGDRRTWDPRTAFNGTASYYARYRTPYPPETFGVLREKFHLTPSSRVLDLGCGPGNVALALSAIVGQIFAVDPNEEMLAEARRLTGEGRIENIEFITAESADLPALAGRLGTVDLTVMGRSFHWMDRDQTLRDLYKMTVPGGGVALLADNANHPLTRTSWRDIMAETTERWLGKERRAGTTGTYTHPEEPHEVILGRSAFTEMAKAHIEASRTWTVDEIIGYLYSTSSTSAPVLGDKKEASEADLRERLLAAEPSGRFAETVTVEILMSRKPAG